MGFLDKARQQLTRTVDQHGDKISKGVDQAASALDKKTGGKHSGKIAQGRAQARSALSKLETRDGGTGADDPRGGPDAPPRDPRGGPDAPPRDPRSGPDHPR